MKIAHISVGSIPVLHRFGGAIQRRIMAVARRQAERGAEVVVYSVGDGPGRVEHDGVEVVSASAAGGPHDSAGSSSRPGPWPSWSAGRSTSSTSTTSPKGALIACGLKAIKVLSFDYFLFHGGPRSPLYPIYRTMLDAFDDLLPVSAYCRDEASHFWQIAPRRMAVVYNGVDLDQFRPDPEAGRAERESWGLSGRVLLSVGLVGEAKGSDLLLDAFRRLRRERDDVRLVVAGPIGQFGEPKGDAGDWRSRIRAVGGHYLGAVDEARLAAVYNAADVFVMPTRAFEMFGMAAVEAQATGRPVVASDHGGLRETVPACCGGRFPNGDAEGLARAVARLLDDPEAYASASSLARAHAVTFGWSRIVDRLDDVYRAGRPDSASFTDSRRLAVAGPVG